MLDRAAAPQLVAIGSLIRRPELQPRVHMSETLIAGYQEAMEAGAEFPSLDVVELPDGSRILADGFHRCEAAEGAGIAEFKAYVWRGTYDEAIEFIVRRNAKHGARRTEADLGKAVRMLRSLSKWRQASNIDVAKHFGVSEATIRRAQGQSLSSSCDEDASTEKTRPASQRTVTVKRGVQEYRMRVERQPAPAAEPEAVPLSREDTAEAAKIDQERYAASNARIRQRDARAVLRTLTGDERRRFLAEANTLDDILAWRMDTLDSHRRTVADAYFDATGSIDEKMKHVEHVLQWLRKHERGDASEPAEDASSEGEGKARRLLKRG